MLAKFRVSNFKSFGENFEIDFTKSKKYDFNTECIKNGIINHSIVYGRNGVGKSNLGFAIFDIIGHLTDKKNAEQDNEHYINAKSKIPFAEFYYEFHFEKYIVTYLYRKKDYNTILYESFSINGRELASIDRLKNNEAVIKFEGTETLNTNLETNTKISVLKYIKQNGVLHRNPTNEIFYKFINFVDKMLFFRSLKDNLYIGFDTREGTITDDIIERNNVKDFESFLNKAGIDCKLEVVDDLRKKKVLAFDFEGKRIPFFDIASQGTLSLTLFYGWFQDIKENGKVSFLFIDEFDAFYHHELSELIVEELKKTGVQFILTTHNTSIMSNDLLRPDCYFVMNKDKIYSLPNLTDKELREGHNLEKIYKANGFSF